MGDVELAMGNVNPLS